MGKMQVSDYIIDFFIKKGITDIFGYQGGMIAYLFDSMGKYKNRIKFHELSNEQGSALAACSFCQASGQIAVVITTSGPGFTNALTGLANAWFDSIPMILIAGQVNTKDKRRMLKIRQNGFQEIQSQLVSGSLSKKTYEVDDDTDIIELFDNAYYTVMNGRKGPVVIDLPINICRNIINVETKYCNYAVQAETNNVDIMKFITLLKTAKRPVIIAGAGISQAQGGTRESFKKLISRLAVPVITTMPAIDLVETDDVCCMGYLGGTARRTAGIILKNADLVISLGARLCPKQIGYDYDKFAPNAKLVRIDIDINEMERKIKPDEIDYFIDLEQFFKILNKTIDNTNYKSSSSHGSWLQSCGRIKQLLSLYDMTEINKFVSNLTDLLPDGSNITLDVGNNLVYSAQSSIVKSNTRVFMSAGLGAMGYAIPASIGASVGRGGITCAICGDGGAQMNIQELNYISKKKLPIKIIVLNNKALGHIVLFQEMYLDRRFVGTRESDGDYCSCNFAKIAEAYGLRSFIITKDSDIKNYKDQLTDAVPTLFEYEYTNCSILPNIHGGHDYLREGPPLPEEIINTIVHLLGKQENDYYKFGKK